MKKFLSILLLCAILLSFPVIAHAESEDSNESEVYSGEIIPSEEEEQEYLSSLSKTDLLKIKQKETEAKLIEKFSKPTARAAYKISIPGTFTIYQQSKSYYCVPACVKSVLQYINGKSDSQDKIASDLGTIRIGTDGRKIAPYLNKKQKSFYYARLEEPSKTLMESCLYATIARNKKPCLMAIITESNDDWYYTTRGHRLVVNAIYSDKSRIQFADPMGKLNSNWPYFYVKSSTLVKKVCNDIIW
ncbi:hypothetical protein DXD93_07735 [Ruminococcus bromii]|jgi:hypothetical protein|nr:C39 family peptidase [Ruminococcus bromii]RGI70180.1 hypothetical protein DXD93_07735 [Ruminococcus bromii]